MINKLDIMLTAIYKNKYIFSLQQKKNRFLMQKLIIKFSGFNSSDNILYHRILNRIIFAF